MLGLAFRGGGESTMIVQHQSCSTGGQQGMKE